VYLVWVFVKRGFLRHISYRLAFWLGIFNMVMGVISFVYLSRLIQSGNTRLLAEYGNNAAAFLIVGTTYNTFVGVALRNVAMQIQNDQSVGVLEHLLMGRVGLTRLGIYSALYDFAFAAFMAAVSFMLLALLFEVPVLVSPSALVVFLLSILGIGGLGMASAGVVLVTKQGDPITLTVGLLAGFLSGVYYPPEVLPGWLASLSYALPMTYGLRALRHTLINGADLSTLLTDVAVLAVFAAVTIPLGLWCFQWGFLKARRDGTLSHY
jgi:ABC-2 type transport system permease protein